MSGEEEVRADLLVFARGYSLLRRGNLKWVHQLVPVAKQQAIHERFITIQRTETLVEVYSGEDLRRRSALKQHPVLFRLFQKIWSLLNPFHIKLVSRRVLRAFNDFLYEKLFGPTPDSAPAQPFALMDLDIDLVQGTKSGLCFTEFYDSLFEVVDNWAKSKLITEYALISRRIIAELESANWLQRLELHSKAHIVSSPSHQYSAWMLPLLPASVPRLIRNPVTHKPKAKSGQAPATRDIQTAGKKTRIQKDVFLSQIKELSNTSFKPSGRRRELNLSLRRSFAGSGEMRLTSPKRPKLMKEILSPISTTGRSGKRSGRLPGLIEDVMQEREQIRQFSESSLHLD